MTGKALLEASAASGIMPVFNHSDPEICVNVIEACYKAGIRVFEFTNRGEDAVPTFANVKSMISSMEGLYLGAGTIMDVHAAQQFVEAGAEFLVSPIVSREVADFAVAQEISWTPGCGTLTEIIEGQQLGAELIKIFPGSVLGPGFVKAVLGPCPDLKLMPTGGVKPEKANIQGWFHAGVHCAGLGSQLFGGDLIQPAFQPKLIATLKQVKSWIHEGA